MQKNGSISLTYFWKGEAMFSVRVPATSANLGPGFDSLGIALKLYNTFRFKKIEKGVKIRIKEVETGNSIELPLHDNLVYVAMKHLFSVCNKPLDGIEVVEEISIPMARGLGSSATAIIAGLVGANRLLENPFKQSEILKIAIEIEKHPDNVVPALMGGFVISVTSEKEHFYKKIEVDENLQVILVTPSFQLQTEALRQVLPKQVDYQDAIFNHSRTALLAASLYDADWDLLSVAMQDRLHQDYRSALIPGFKYVLEKGYQAGAIGVALSGAGPTVLAFSRKNSKEIGEVMVSGFAKHNIHSKYIVTCPDNKGLQWIE